MKHKIHKYPIDATGNVCMPRSSRVLRTDLENKFVYALVAATKDKLDERSLNIIDAIDSFVLPPSSDETVIGMSQEIDVSSVSTTISLIGTPWAVQEKDGVALVFHNSHGPIKNYTFVSRREGDTLRIDLSRLIYLGYALEHYVFLVKQ